MADDIFEQSGLPMNRFACGVGDAGDILILTPVRRLTRAQALNLAAWLVVLAGVEDEIATAVAVVRNS